MPFVSRLNHIQVDLTSIKSNEESCAEEQVETLGVYDRLEEALTKLLNEIPLDLSVENDGVGFSESMGKPDFDAGKNYLDIYTSPDVRLTILLGEVTKEAGEGLLRIALLGVTRKVEKDGVSGEVGFFSEDLPSDPTSLKYKLTVIMKE